MQMIQQHSVNIKYGFPAICPVKSAFEQITSYVSCLPE